MRLQNVLLAVAVCGVIPLAAQVSQPPVFRAGTDLVEVDVIARDKNGTFVSDLSIDDFELQEDGKPYPVQQVYLRLAGPNGWSDTLRNSPAAGNVAAPAPASPSTDVHRVFVVVFDDAHLSSGGFKRTQAAAQALFQSQLRDGDIGGVVSNGRMANGRLTSNRAELIKAAKDAKPGGNVLSVEMDERLWPRLSEIEAVRIAVNEDQELFDMAARRACNEDRSACQGPAGDDAVRGMIQGKAFQMSTNVRVEATRTLAMLRSVLSGLARVEGPKNVLLMTEGFISEETWPDVRDAVSAAARANTRIYTLDARGLGNKLVSVASVAPTDPLAFMYEQMDLAADSINSLAVDTGGFVVRNTNQFDRAVAQIADDAGNYYVLGYLPPSPADGKFHRIRVKVRRPGVNLRSRRGYTATPRARPVVTATAAAAASAIVSGFSRTEPTTEPDASSVRPTPDTTDTTADPKPDTSAAGLKPETTDGSVAAAIVPAPSGTGSSTMRLRPDASKHIDLLLPDPSADRAAAAGWEAYQRGDVETARASFRIAAASPAAEAWVHYALGQSEYALGEYARAVAEWEKVHATARTFEPVYFDLVDGYLQLKQHDKAIRLLREGATSWPKDPEIFNALGVVQTVRGSLDDAIASFQAAADAAPADAVSYFNLGRAFELRYFRSRRFVRQTNRWTANEKDRTSAMGHYERYLTFGGPYADAAREGIMRLKWVPNGQ
jgi:VWFA-related protein